MNPLVEIKNPDVFPIMKGSGYKPSWIIKSDDWCYYTIDELICYYEGGFEDSITVIDVICIEEFKSVNEQFLSVLEIAKRKLKQRNLKYDLRTKLRARTRGKDFYCMSKTLEKFLLKYSFFGY